MTCNPRLSKLRFGRVILDGAEAAWLVELSSRQRRTERAQVLGVERAQGRFNSRAQAHDPIAHVRAQKSHPKCAPLQTSGLRTAEGLLGCAWQYISTRCKAACC